MTCYDNLCLVYFIYLCSPVKVYICVVCFLCTDRVHVSATYSFSILLLFNHFFFFLLFSSIMFSYVLHILCDEHFKYDHVTYVELRNLPSTCGHNKDVPLGHSIHSILKGNVQAVSE